MGLCVIELKYCTQFMTERQTDVELILIVLYRDSGQLDGMQNNELSSQNNKSELCKL